MDFWEVAPESRFHRLIVILRANRSSGGRPGSCHRFRLDGNGTSSWQYFTKVEHRNSVKSTHKALTRDDKDTKKTHINCPRRKRLKNRLDLLQPVSLGRENNGRIFPSLYAPRENNGRIFPRLYAQREKNSQAKYFVVFVSDASQQYRGPDATLRGHFGHDRGSAPGDQTRPKRWLFSRAQFTQVIQPHSPLTSGICPLCQPSCYENVE